MHSSSIATKTCAVTLVGRSNTGVEDSGFSYKDGSHTMPTYAPAKEFNPLC